MKYMLDLGLWGAVFAVPTQIVDKHLKLCGVAQLKVLLTLLRHSGEGMELSALAAALNLNTADTQDALNYWLQCGVLAARETGDGAVLSPVAAPVAAPVASATPSTEPVPTAEPALKAEPIPSQPAVSAPHSSRAGHAPPQRPKPLEIQQMVKTDSNLKALIEEVEAALGKTFTSSDLSTIVSLYDWAGIPADVLLTVVGYCKMVTERNGREKVSLRFIEQVATDWQDLGIDTLDKADRHVTELLDTDQQVQAVKSAFGIYDRSLTSKETAYVRQWFDVFHFELPLIRLAYERAIDSKGKLSFPYIGGILEKWQKGGVRTSEDAVRADEAFSRKRREEQPGSSFDIDEIEERLLRGSPKLN